MKVIQAHRFVIASLAAILFSAGAAFIPILPGIQTFPMISFAPVQAAPDADPTITINTALSQNTGVENGGTITVVAELDSAAVDPLTVPFTLSGAAVQGVDYTVSASEFSFPAASTQSTILITPINDSLNEADEAVTLTFANAAGVTLGTPNSHTATITDDDPVPSLSISPTASTAEGNSTSDQAVLSFTVTLSSASGQTVTVDYATQEGSATSSTDFEGSSGTLTFNPGETEKVITVQIIEDTRAAANETFQVQLSNPVHATLGGTSTGVGTITNDDADPSLTISATVSSAEGNVTSDQRTLAFYVNLNNASEQTVTVNFATQAGSASDSGAEKDFESNSGALTFIAGDTVEVISVQIIEDTRVELDENLQVHLSSPTNATLGSPSTGVGTITNDDLPTMSIDNVTVTEADSSSVNANFTVSLSEPSLSTVSVNYQTANGTASAGTDYTVWNQTALTFAPGIITQTITVEVRGDTIYEGPEIFYVNLGQASGATLVGTGRGVGTIQDNENPPAIRISDTSITEGNSGTVTAQFSVQLSGASSSQVRVDYQTANDTALAGLDYNSRSGTLTFNPGEVNASVSIEVLGDTLDEANETFSVNLSGPSGATIADGTANGTITDDDGSPSLTIDDVEVVEGDASDSTAVFTLELAPASGQTVTVDYATSDGTAKASENDYTPASGKITFAPGETTKNISVTIRGDFQDESDETFFLELKNPHQVSVGDWEGLGTIIDNDSVGLNITPNTALLTDENGLEKTFTVMLETKPVGDVTVNLASSDATEATVSPASLVFTPANWNLPQIARVKGVDDLIQDGNVDYEILFATVSAADSRYNNLRVSPIRGTNADNDTAGITVHPTTEITTTETGLTTTFLVVLNTQPLHDVTVNVTSTLPTEGVVSPASISFTPLTWNVPQTVLVTGVDDLLDDDTQTYTITVGKATSVDPAYHNLDPQDVRVENLDDDGPDLAWVSPTVNAQGYYVLGRQDGSIMLQVQPMKDDAVIRHVRFIRWDYRNQGSHVELGTDDTPPFEIQLNTDQILFKFNQLWAIAYDMNGNHTAIQPTIFLYKPAFDRFLPWISNTR